MSQERRRKTPRDLAILQGPTDDGQGARVLRVREGEVSAGELRPAREGEPLGDRELVRLSPVQAGLPICEVEVLHAPSTPQAATTTPSSQKAAVQGPGESGSRGASGPARVATQSYRKNWSSIFGKRKRDAYSVN